MPPPEFIRPVLQSFGYALSVVPSDGSVTCRAAGEGEAWEASGATADEAADKLVRKMCPSALAFGLFLEALHGEREPTQRIPSTPSAKSPPIRVAVVDRRQASSLVDHPHIEEAAASSRRTLTADFEAALPSIARSSPERMRLALLRRLCMARAAAAQSPDNFGDAQAVAARVLEVARAFWTGSAPGLRSDARPADVGAVRRGWMAPSTWGEAAETAKRALEDVDDRGLRAGHDAFGWADTALLDPPPPDAIVMLAEVNAELDALLGPPGKPHAQDAPAIPLRAKRLEAAARRIRWLRDAVDPIAWATAAGRVRHAVIDIGPDGESAERLLDPSFRPPTTWAALDRFSPAAADDDDDDEDDDDEDEGKETPAPPPPSPVKKRTIVAAKAKSVPPPAPAPPPPPPPPPPAPSGKGAAGKRGHEPPPVGGSTGELAGWALRVLGQLDTPEFLTLARPALAELRNLGEGGIPTHDRRIKRKWREVLRRLG